ncbi:MAG: YlcI/YnfO family protein [Eubacterium sp.]
MFKIFIIKKPVSKNKTIRMPEDLIDRMETLAESKAISFNQLVIQCCEYALNDLKNQNEPDE